MCPDDLSQLSVVELTDVYCFSSKFGILMSKVSANRGERWHPCGHHLITPLPQLATTNYDFVIEANVEIPTCTYS